MNYRLILFDADGTLFDYNRAESYALENTLSCNGLKYNSDILKKYQEFNSIQWKLFEQGKVTKLQLQRDRFAHLLDFLGVNTINPLDLNSIYLDFLGNGGFLIDGAFEICKALSQKYTLAIATNGIEKTQKSRLNNSLIKDLISFIAVSEAAGHAKPSVHFFEYAMNLCNNPDKTEVLIIGDSLTADIKGGIDFGIDTCWYNPDKKLNSSDIRPKYEINRLEEIYAIL